MFALLVKSINRSLEKEEEEEKAAQKITKNLVVKRIKRTVMNITACIQTEQIHMTV